MILFIDEYVSVFRRKEKRLMRSVSSKHPVLDETNISMNVSFGGADGGQMRGPPRGFGEQGTSAFISGE